MLGQNNASTCLSGLARLLGMLRVQQRQYSLIKGSEERKAKVYVGPLGDLPCLAQPSTGGRGNFRLQTISTGKTPSGEVFVRANFRQTPKELWAMVREHKTRSAQSAERNVARQWPTRP